MYKICKACGEEKELSFFHKQKMGYLGVQSKCKICRNNIQLEYCRNNRDKILESSRRHYAKNSEKCRAKSLDYYRNNTEYRKKRIEKNASYLRNRRKNNPILRAAHSLSVRLKRSFIEFNENKNASILEVLGCNILFFKKHIENMFTGQMSWDNRGIVWHIDHICPISQALTIEDVIKLNHYSNLRPLYVKDNLSKYTSIDEEGLKLRKELLGR